jgi:hypothetical protein
MGRVLVACESSGVVRSAFRALGHDAWSCDILPADDGSPYHLQEKVQHGILAQCWDLVIAHPPCTRLCNSGVRWLAERDLWNDMEDGAALFISCLAANADMVAVENPVMHKYAREIIGRGPDFTVQPWLFGDNFKKRTCFWTRNLPPLVATSDLDGSTAKADCHLASPGPLRWKVRSKTYAGIAAAMASQWGALIPNQPRPNILATNGNNM